MREIDFRMVVGEAINEEFNSLPDIENLDYEYEFTYEFRNKMKKLIKQYEGIKDGKFIQRSVDDKKVNKSKLKRLVIVVLIAVLVLTLVACVASFYIKWIEVNNTKNGTLDVTFKVSGQKSKEKGELVLPATPKGFEIISKYEEDIVLWIRYKNKQEKVIDYIQQTDTVDTISMSIDNDDEKFSEISINGYKGYASEEENCSYVVWVTENSVYSMSGNVDMDIIMEMARSIGK